MMNQQPEAQPDLVVVVGDENYLKIDHLSTICWKSLQR